MLVEKAAPLNAALLEAILDASIRRRLLDELERDRCDSGGGKIALGGGSMLGWDADVLVVHNTAECRAEISHHPLPSRHTR